MSRAMNIDLPIVDVEQMCRKHGSAISAIETLPIGCTRVVLKSGEAAVAMRRRFGKKVIQGHVERASMTVRQRPR